MGQFLWKFDHNSQNKDNIKLMINAAIASEEQTPPQTKDNIYSAGIFLNDAEIKQRKEQAENLRRRYNNIHAQRNWLGKSWDILKNGFGLENCPYNLERKISDFETYSDSYEQVNNALKDYDKSQNQIKDAVSSIQSAAKGAYEGITEWDREQTARVLNVWSKSDIGALAKGDFKTFLEIQKNSSAAELVKGNFGEAAKKFGEENRNLSTALGFETAKDGYREAYKMAENAVDDGDDTKLTAAEKTVAVVGGVGDFADDITTPVGLASLPLFNGLIKGGNWLLSKMPSFVGKTVSVGLVADGSRRMGNGIYDIVAADTKEEVKEGTGKVIDGVIETGIGFGSAASLPKNAEIDALSQELKADPKTKSLAKLLKGEKTTQESLTLIKREVAKIYRPDVNVESKSVFQKINGMIEDAKKSLKLQAEIKSFKGKIKKLFKKETKHSDAKQCLLEYKPIEETMVPKDTATVKAVDEKSVTVPVAKVEPKLDAVPKLATEIKVQPKLDVKPVEITKPKAETPYAEAAGADSAAALKGAEPAAEGKMAEPKIEVAKAEPKTEITVIRAEAVANKPLPKTIEEFKTWCNELNIDPYDTEFIVKSGFLNDSNIDIISELIALKINGKPRFTSSDIIMIALETNSEKSGVKSTILELAKLMNKNEPRCEGTDISIIVKFLCDKNKNILKDIINKTDNNGNPLYSVDEIVLLLQLHLRELNSKSFHEKDLLCSILSKDIKCAKDKKTKMELQKKLDLLQKSINKALEPIPVSKEANNEFWHNFLTTANKENAKVIKGLERVIEKYGQEGLPLEFSRADFVKELKAKLETLPEEQRTEILKKLDIQLNDNSYEGFIDLKGIDGTVAKEAEIKSLCERFLLENRINTGDPQIDKFLNSIIKGIPELVNIIGKKQHGMHQYTLDGHTLKVLKEVVSNPKFETLSNQDKMIAQLMALFHDIGKLEGVEDTGHEFMSSVMANDILGKVNLPEFTKKRIVELIKNHNWLQQMSEGQITPETAAVIFRNPEDVKIAEIFAEADLKGVGTGNMIVQTRILNGDKIPTVEFQGHTYRVLDISKLPEGTDLTQFGLSTKDKKDLRFLFHKGNFEKLEQVTKPFNEGYACTTLITPSKKSTFVEKKSDVGMLLESPNQNVIGAYNFDQFTPTRQGLNGFLEMTKNDFAGRIYQRDIILRSLSKKYSVTERDYAEIFKQLISKKSLSQIKDVVLSNGTTIKAEDIINAYRAFENDLLIDSGTDRLASYNEVNLYLPQIKGAILIGESLSEIPAETLQFIRERNLPIFIILNGTSLYIL